VIEVEVRNGRKEKFEKRYGAGVVQLNALTVNPVHLRWFADLLETAIYALRDPDIAEKIDVVEAEAQALVDSEVGRRFHWIHTAYDLLRERAVEARQEERDKTAEERSALAAKAAKSKHTTPCDEIVEIRQEMKSLADLVRQKKVTVGVGSVVNQILGNMLRTFEQQRRQKEFDDLERRLEEVERRYARRHNAQEENDYGFGSGRWVR